MKTYRWWITLVTYASLSMGVAQAFEGGHFGGSPGHAGGEPGHVAREPGHFTEHPAAHGLEPRRDDHARWGRHGVDVERWHGGHWFHGDHLGRAGWWWIVDGGWYFYPAPVYPYPDPSVPPAVIAPSGGYWYYCRSAGAYYPYVTVCPEDWSPVTPQAPAS